MPRIKNTITVEEVPGEPYRYHVESWGSPGFPHKVDILEHGGNGECSCQDFTGRCRKNLRENGGRHVPYLSMEGKAANRTQCKHIEAARRYFLRKVLAKISEDLHGSTT